LSEHSNQRLSGVWINEPIIAIRPLADMCGKIDTLWPLPMLRIRPFIAVHPQPNNAAQVASVPYDVVNTAEARELAKGLPNSFLHVVRSEIDLPEKTNPYDDAVYAKARENLHRLIDEDILVRDTQPRMFLYRQVMSHKSQIGLVCCCHIDDYANGSTRRQSPCSWHTAIGPTSMIWSRRMSTIGRCFISSRAMA
jgi:hypothetical protein